MADSPTSSGAHSDNINQQFSIIGVQGTLGTADTKGTAYTLPFGVNPATGAAYVQNLGTTIDSLAPYIYDTITVTYPSGSVEVYSYSLGTTALGTISVTYTSATKGSISTVVKT